MPQHDEIGKIILSHRNNDLAKSYRHRIPLLYPRYPYLEFRVSIYKGLDKSLNCPPADYGNPAIIYWSLKIKCDGRIVYI